MDRLEVLTLSRNQQTLNLVLGSFQELNISGSYCHPDSGEAFAIITKKHFDGILVDCDDLAQTTAMVEKIREGPSNRECPLIALVDKTVHMHALRERGVKLTIYKPSSSDQLKVYLSNVIPLVQQEHDRYARYETNLRAEIIGRGSIPRPARLVNVSAEGVALSTMDSSRPAGTIRLRFELPSIDPFPMDVEGDVAWADALGRAGVKFRYLSAEPRRKYSEWLAVLRGQQEFRRSMAN